MRNDDIRRREEGREGRGEGGKGGVRNANSRSLLDPKFEGEGRKEERRKGGREWGEGGTYPGSSPMAGINCVRSKNLFPAAGKISL